MLILMFAWQDGKLRLFQLFVKKKKVESIIRLSEVHFGL